MKVIQRERIKGSVVFSQLLDIIRKDHVISQEIHDLVFDKRKDLDSRILTRHFAVKNNLFIHYDTACWFRPPRGTNMRVERIAIYDSKEEYLTAFEKAVKTPPVFGLDYYLNNDN